MANLNKGKGNLKDNKIVKKIFDTSDSNDKHFVSSTEETIISQSYANAEHLSTINFYEFAPIMYQLKLVQDEIEELREFISTELATTSSMEPVSASFANVSQSIFNLNDKNSLQTKINMNETKLSSFNIGDSAQGITFATASLKGKTVLGITVGTTTFQIT
jgi:hypothetical protein